MKTFQLWWAPEGRLIATVQARYAAAALNKAPLPYRRFRGGVYIVEVT